MSANSLRFGIENGNEMKPAVDICECDWLRICKLLVVGPVEYFEYRSPFTHLTLIQPKNFYYPVHQQNKQLYVIE